MAIKRFVFPLNYAADSPNAQGDFEFFFEEYKKLLAVSWVGSHGDNIDIEIRTHDGKEDIVSSVPIEYYKLGNGREEMVINRVLANNAVRIKPAFESGHAVKGSLIFTLEEL